MNTTQIHGITVHTVTTHAPNWDLHHAAPGLHIVKGDTPRGTDIVLMDGGHTILNTRTGILRADDPDTHAQRVDGALTDLAHWASIHLALHHYGWARYCAEQLATRGDATPPATAASAANLPAADTELQQLLDQRAAEMPNAPQAIRAAVAERDLHSWAERRDAVDADRDRLVRHAIANNVNRNTVHRITGMSRSTINRLLAGGIYSSWDALDTSPYDAAAFNHLEGAVDARGNVWGKVTGHETGTIQTGTDDTQPEQ